MINCHFLHVSLNRIHLRPFSLFPPIPIWMNERTTFHTSSSNWLSSEWREMRLFITKIISRKVNERRQKFVTTNFLTDLMIFIGKFQVHRFLFPLITISTTKHYFLTKINRITLSDCSVLRIDVDFEHPRRLLIRGDMYTLRDKLKHVIHNIWWFCKRFR